MAVTETTVRALRDIQPDGDDLSQPVFGLTGEALANRIRAAPRAAGLGEDFSGHSGRIGMARRMVAAGGADRGGPAPRPVEARGHGRPLHPGRGRRRGAEVADLASVYSAALIFWCGIKQGFWGPVSPDFRKPQPGRDLPLHLDLQHVYTTLVLQRRFKEGWAGRREVQRGAWHGSAWPVRYYPAYPRATAATQPARTVLGAASPAPPGRPAAS